jgi:YD repeat-containing protein
MVYENTSDRVKSVTDPVTGTMSYTYLVTGERKTVTYPGGGTVTYNYLADTANGVGSSSLPKGDPNSVLHILDSIVDENGRIVKMLNQPVVGSLPFRFDGSYLGMDYNQTFDGSGNRVSYLQSVPRYDWNDNYGEAGNRGILNSTETKFYWKNLTPGPNYGQWLNKMVSKNEYVYNQQTGQKVSNLITDQYNNTRTESYNYDELSRLSGVSYGDGQTQGYSFDSMGNRLAKTDNQTGSESYVYNNANMLLSRNGQGYTNDVNGNTLSGGGRTMTWD